MIKANIYFKKNEYNKGFNLDTELTVAQTYPLVMENKKVRVALGNVSLSDFFSLLPDFERRIGTEGHFFIRGREIRERVDIRVYRWNNGDFHISGTTYDDTCFTVYAYPYCTFRISFTEKELRDLVKKDMKKVRGRDFLYLREQIKAHLLREFSEFFETIKKEIPRELVEGLAEEGRQRGQRGRAHT